MRIIAGKLKGSALYTPTDKSTRPLKDRARESIFNLLIHSKKICFQFKNSNILDLYAGTGSFGLECLSREAKNVCFVENEKNAITILKRNIQKLRLKKKTKIFSNEVFNLIKERNVFDSKFNLIFCDPPFKNKNIEDLIELIFKNNLIENGGIIVLHRNKNSLEKLPNYFETIDKRIYGISKIIFGRLLS